jgi:hypothetical protein
MLPAVLSLCSRSLPSPPRATRLNVDRLKDRQFFKLRSGVSVLYTTHIESTAGNP